MVEVFKKAGRSVAKAGAATVRVPKCEARICRVITSIGIEEDESSSRWQQLQHINFRGDDIALGGGIDGHYLQANPV
jgi:hypothetical protein